MKTVSHYSQLPDHQPLGTQVQVRDLVFTKTFFGWDSTSANIEPDADQKLAKTSESADQLKFSALCA